MRISDWSSDVCSSDLGFTLGPVAIIGIGDLPATQLIQPGSLYESKYRVRLPAGADPAMVGKRLTAEFPEAGWKVNDRSTGAPGTRRFIERKLGSASCGERVGRYV